MSFARIRLLPLLLFLSLIISSIEIDMAVPGFVAMAQHFNVADAVIQKTITYNFLGFFLAALVLGPLSDAYGRRIVMLYGCSFLVIGAVSCVFFAFIQWPSSIMFILFFRFVQGMGAATPAVVAFAMIADVYKGEAATRLIGFMNATLSVCIALAPVVGSFIVIRMGWQGNYSIVAFLSVIVGTALFLWLPETLSLRNPVSIKDSVSTFKMLLSSPSFVVTSLIPTLLYATYMSFIACSAFLYIETFGLSVTAYGFHQGAIVGAFTLTSLSLTKMTSWIGVKRSVCMGGFLVILGPALLCMLDDGSPYCVSICVSLFCIGFALIYPPIFAASMNYFPNCKGAASSLIMGKRALIVAGWVALTSRFFDGSVISIAVIMCSISVIAMMLLVLFRTRRHLNNRED